MTHLGLFEGIGGFSLAARWAGWETVAWCEWDKNCQRVLKHHFPNAIPHGDITQTDFTGYAGRVDVLTGGFPCQPYSTAGKRLGKEDDRHLWPEMLRAVREIAPRWVVGENVRGLVSWNGGMVFDEVQADLEAEGYEVFPFILPACAVGAPHRRDRVWFVAHRAGQHEEQREQEVGRVWPKPYAQRNAANAASKLLHWHEPGEPGNARAETVQQKNWKAGAVEPGTMGEMRPFANSDQGAARPPGKGGGPESERSENGSKPELRREQAEQHIGRGELLRDAADADCEQRCEGRMHSCIRQEAERHAGPCGAWPDWRAWENFPTQPPVRGGNDGIPRKLDAITFSKWREFAIGAYGNAIVPQVAYQIFKAINGYEKIHDHA